MAIGAVIKKEAIAGSLPNSYEGQSLTYCLVHGSFHGGWCWKYLQKSLEAMGNKTIVMDLNFEDRDAGMADFADFVSSTIPDEKNTVLVAHSRMTGLIPRVAANLTLHSAVALCYGFDHEYGTIFERKLGSPMPEKYNKDFLAGLVRRSRFSNIYTYDKSTAKQVFYHDCDDQTQEWAAELLRPMNRARKEKPILNWPDIRLSLIYTRQDRVINPSYSDYVAHALGIKAIKLAGGHCPFLSRPAELAAELGRIANTRDDALQSSTISECL